jgi:hypothetical protein
MKEGLRQSMAWLHTWCGLLVCWVLLLVFAGGSASYFKEEISLWMMPELHASAAAPVTQAQAIERAALICSNAPQASAGSSPCRTNAAWPCGSAGSPRLLLPARRQRVPAQPLQERAYQCRHRPAWRGYVIRAAASSSIACISTCITCRCNGRAGS